MKSIRIGVLGGIGPEATGKFYLKLISSLQEKQLIKNNSDYPQIIINSIPAPELIFENVNSEMIAPYRKGLQELDKMNVDFIVMVCNTIHFFLEELQQCITAPIIDLRKEVGKTLIRQRIKTMTVLGTPTTIRNGLYEQEGIRCIRTTDKDIERITKLIYNFNTGTQKEKQREILRQIAKKYVLQGSETIILGCTELAVLLKGSKLPVIDPMDILISSIIERRKYSQ